MTNIKSKTTDCNDNRWGPKGHILIHREALLNLPEEVPAFLRTAGDHIETLAFEADAMRRKDLPYLKGATSSDHYFNLEAWQDKPLPADRQHMLMTIGRSDLDPAQIGLLPYRISELYEEVKFHFARWRNQPHPDSPAADQAEKNVIRTCGLLGHFVGDASQPLHVTRHFDRWDSAVPNPEGFRTAPGLHYQFESLLVASSVHQDQVHDKIGPLQVRQGDALQLSMELIGEASSQVIPLFELEKKGAFNPKTPSPEGIGFATLQVARGAQNLRDLWFSAWLESEALAQTMEQEAHSKNRPS